MELSAKSIALSIVLVTVVTWAWRVVNWLWLRPKKLERYLRQQGFKGTPYRLLNGDLKEIYMMTKEARSRTLNFTDDPVPHLVPFLHKLVKDYGKNSYRWIGPTPRLIVMNPDLLKEIFNRFQDFQKVPPNPLSRLLATGILIYDGEKWIKHRRIINPAFHQEKLKLMLPAFYQSCHEMISQWENLDFAEGSCELDVWPCLLNLTSDVISRTAFGSNYEEGKQIFQLQRELADHVVQMSSQSIYIPGWRFLPTERNNRMKKIDKQMRASLISIIKSKEKAMKAGETVKDDLLGILLESNCREIEQNGQNKNDGITIEDVIEECKLFYLAGHETTSVLLVWTMILLSIHQNWQDRAREEVLQVFGDNKKPNYDGLNQLKIVSMILYEVLRFYPPAVSVERVITKDTKLGNMSLPAGVQFSLPIILVHHDQELWGDDAKEFKPERFSEGVSKATNGQVAFFPFAWGPRICIGQNFALIEAKMALAMMLRKFKFELSPKYVHDPCVVVTLHPGHGAPLILKKL